MKDLAAQTSSWYPWNWREWNVLDHLICLTHKHVQFMFLNYIFCLHKSGNKGYHKQLRKMIQISKNIGMWTHNCVLYRYLAINVFGLFRWMNNRCEAFDCRSDLLFFCRIVVNAWKLGQYNIQAATNCWTWMSIKSPIMMTNYITNFIN